MARLYATIENSRGKIVSLSDNETLTATVYDGNKKAYSVTIDFGDIGDIVDNDGNELPDHLKSKGVMISCREWRNQPDERRKAQRK